MSTSAILVLGNPSAEFLDSLQVEHGRCEVRHLQGAEMNDAREVFSSEIFQWALLKKPLVVTYSAGWTGSTALMSELMVHFTGRSPESIQYYLFDMGVEVKSQSFTKGMLSIKDLIQALDQDKLSDSHRAQFQILSELIR